jgi:CheY-like chemotaxis protein
MAPRQPLEGTERRGWGAATTMRPLILVVDDTPLARSTLRRTLETAGYHIVEAGSTEEAIRVYREEWPDLVTMDMLMDGHNGIVAIQAIQHIDHNAKIIVCSATSNQSFVAGAAQLGIKIYLNKPIDPARLLAAVAATLGKVAP